MPKYTKHKAYIFDNNKSEKITAKEICKVQNMYHKFIIEIE